MLAQNFKTADDLKLTEDQKAALMKTLVLLETDRLEHKLNIGPAKKYIHRNFSGHFNMSWWTNPQDCGTVCCIGGTAELVGDVRFHDRGGMLGKLFYPGRALRGVNYDNITPEQAATALRSYLTTGDPRWDLAVAPSKD